MIDDAWPRRKGGRRFHVGCAVELTAGVLNGMTGVVVRFSRGHNCLIRLDGVENGVLLVINAGSLKSVRPGCQPAPLCPVKDVPPRRRPAGFGFTGA